MDKNLITNDVLVKGFNELLLKVGNKYEIHYGIHQGIYEYVGSTKDGQRLFKSLKTNKVSFGYYSKISPFEFTSIVKSL